MLYAHRRSPTLPVFVILSRLFFNVDRRCFFIHPFILNLLHHVPSAPGDTLFPIHFMALHLIGIYGGVAPSSSSTFRFTHSFWMVIWFACCCSRQPRQTRSPNKWEMCVASRNSHLVFCCCFVEDSQRAWRFFRRSFMPACCWCYIFTLHFSISTFEWLAMNAKMWEWKNMKFLFMIP